MAWEKIYKRTRATGHPKLIEYLIWQHDVFFALCSPTSRRKIMSKNKNGSYKLFISVWQINQQLCKVDIFMKFTMLV